METFPKELFEIVEAWIISRPTGEGKVLGVTGGAEDGVWLMESSG